MLACARLDSLEELILSQNSRAQQHLTFSASGHQVREVACNFSKHGLDLRFTSDALLALQESTEDYLVHLFEDA